MYRAQRLGERISFNDGRTSHEPSGHKGCALRRWCQSVSGLVLSLMVRRLRGSLLLLRRVLLLSIPLSSVLLLFNERLEERLIEFLLSCWLWLFQKLLRLLLFRLLFSFELSFLPIVSLISLRIEDIDSVYKLIKRSVIIHHRRSSPFRRVRSRVISIVLLEWLVWFRWELRHHIFRIRRFWNFGDIIEVWVFYLPHHSIEVFPGSEINQFFHEIVRRLREVLSP